MEIKRLRRRATIYGVLAIVAVIAGLVAGWKWIEADRNEVNAMQAKNLAESEARKAKLTLSQSHFLQGIAEIERGDALTGLAYLAGAIRIHPDRQHTAAAARIVHLFLQRSFALPLTDPMQHGGWVGSAVFSPDGSKIVTASYDETARVWDIAPTSKIPVPDWLTSLAEAIGRKRVNDQGILEQVDITEIIQFRKRFQKAIETDPYSQIARWFLRTLPHVPHRHMPWTGTIRRKHSPSAEAEGETQKK